MASDLQNLRIKLDKTNSVFIPGTTVSGELIVNLNEVTTIAGRLVLFVLL